MVAGVARPVGAAGSIAELFQLCSVGAPARRWAMPHLPPTPPPRFQPRRGKNAMDRKPRRDGIRGVLKISWLRLRLLPNTLKIVRGPMINCVGSSVVIF